MKFDCKKISISNEYFGCTVSFYDRKQDGEAQSKMSDDEIIESLGEYIMIQRTYPEDEFETDYRIVETNGDVGGELNFFQIKLSKTMFYMTYDDQIFEIAIKPIDKKFNALKEALKTIAYKQGELIIEE